MVMLWKVKHETQRTEALRLARNQVKRALKREGVKLSTISAYNLTKAARALVAADRSIWYRAKRNLKMR